MSLNDILSSVHDEIARLQKARALLTGSGNSGRSRKSVTMLSAKPKWAMSAEGRANVSKAQRKRWAAQKNAAK